MESAITVLKNRADIIGIKNLENKKIAYVKFGEADHQPFLEQLRLYANIEEVSAKDIGTLNRKLREYNLVIIGVHQSNESPYKKHAFTDKEIFWLEEIARQGTSNSILTVFARPYILSDILSFESVDGVVMAYQNESPTPTSTSGPTSTPWAWCCTSSPPGIGQGCPPVISPAGNPPGPSSGWATVCRNG